MKKLVIVLLGLGVTLGAQGKEEDRLRECAAVTCHDVLVDLSKNRSRRFCEQNCGNRANVAAYRARRAIGSGARGANA